MADIDEYGYVTLGDSSDNHNSSSSKNNSSHNHSTVVSGIKRDSWPLWALLIVTGVASGPLEAHFFVMDLINEIFGLDIPYLVGYIVMGIVGILSGVFISHFAQEKYQSANKGWPWLLLSVCIPLLTFVATAILTAAIALVVGIVYVAIFLIVLAIGGAIAAACCGGG